MCGIVGKIDFSGAVVDQSLIRRMADTIIHRGPDDHGVYTAPHVGLGQRRLSIIDLRSSATAPLSNEDGTVWVVFNGEIYNYQSLRAALIEQGHVFRTSSDTEVLVHLYEEYGDNCLQSLRGMFAFAIWDARLKRLFAARDRFGKKPFFYTRTGKSFLFGSEIKAITADPSVSVSPDFHAIDQYLTNQYVPSPITAFEGISKLPPATWLSCDSQGNVATGGYWEQPSTCGSDKRPRQEIEEGLLQKLSEAIGLRMIADVPLGAFLSGGIDSATIVALMSMQSASPVKTFSIGFAESDYNELPYARLVADRYGTEHHEFTVAPSAAETLPLLVKHYNEPFADASALPTYYVSKITREHVTVALSGDGGDESFAGYGHYRQMMKYSRLDFIPHALRNICCHPLEVGLKRFARSNNLARASRLMQMISGNIPQRYRQIMSLVKEEEKQYLYTQKFRDMSRGVQAGQAIEWDDSMDSLDWMMRHDRSNYLPDCLMVKTDIASMMNSLEVRCPFLDHELVEYVARIPTKYKWDGNVGKVILRNTVRNLLPRDILDKPKTGFAVPVASWFRNELSGLLRSMLLDDVARKRGLFDSRYVHKMFDEHVNGRRDWSNRLWALLFLEMWFREFID